MRDRRRIAINCTEEEVLDWLKTQGAVFEKDNTIFVGFSYNKDGTLCFIVVELPPPPRLSIVNE